MDTWYCPAWQSTRTGLGFCESHAIVEQTTAHVAIAVALVNFTLSDNICAVQMVTDHYAHGTILCAILALVAAVMCMSVSKEPVNQQSSRCLGITATGL